MRSKKISKAISSKASFIEYIYHDFFIAFFLVGSSLYLWIAIVLLVVEKPKLKAQPEDKDVLLEILSLSRPPKIEGIFFTTVDGFSFAWEMSIEHY